MVGSSDLSDCSGVRRACRGSRLDPSPTEAKDLCFWFLMDRMKPLTTTLSVSFGPWSRRHAIDSWDDGLVCKPRDCLNACLAQRATADRTMSSPTRSKIECRARVRDAVGVAGGGVKRLELRLWSEEE